MTCQVMAFDLEAWHTRIMQATVTSFGPALKWWRANRRFSQLELAAAADVSSRHLSFLETGKAKPSREMVIHLATVLDVPLRDRNTLLHAAGFAPVYSHTDFGSPEMAGVRSVVSTILNAHMPNPAMVIDRQGDVLDANGAAFALVMATVPPDSAALTSPLNVHRLIMHPEGTRARTENWLEIAANLLERLERELAHRPADAALSDTVAEMYSYVESEELPNDTAPPTGTNMLLPAIIHTLEGQRLSFLTTISTMGTPYDVTLDELRLETLFPADEETRVALEAWA